MNDKHLGAYPEILVPLEHAGPEAIITAPQQRALFAELHALHDAVAELQRSITQAVIRP